MAQILNNLFGGGKSSASPVPSADSDFADFAEAPSPSPSPFTPVAGGATLAAGSSPAATGPAVPYTKWYNVHERHSLSEFRAEGIILVVIVTVFALHIVGTRLNRAKARKWIRAHAASLTSEFAFAGCDNAALPPRIAAGENKGDELAQAQALVVASDPARADALLKEKSLFEFATYASGRQNVAFVDVRLTLAKRFNPFMSIAETALGFAFEGFSAPEDTLQAVLYPFDGREDKLVPGVPGQAELRAKDSKSAFDGFVWAIVNKERMKKVRDDRYDISITYTKDNAKLPVWLTVMSESAEITDALLTPELAKAAESAGDLLEFLIISDQPIDKPKTLDETTPKKRIYLKYRLPSNNDYAPLLPIFNYFLRMSDQLVQSGRFRPEVMRKVRGVREELIKQIQKADEGEKAEERALEREKARKAKRDAELNALDAKAQKKYLEKEREKEMRKSTKRQTTRG